MNLSFPFLEKLRELPALIELAERRLDELFEATRSLRVIALALDAPSPEPRPEPTFVYLLPPDGPMLAQSARVPRNQRYEIKFEPYRPLEAGTWVVAVGPAQVRAVIVGITFQSSASDYQGHVCKTSDACEVGTRIRVELESLDHRGSTLK